MKGILFIVVACLLWAMDTLIRYPLLGGGVSPLRIVFYEHVILTLCMSVFIIKNHARIWQMQIAHIFYFFVIGSLGSGVATLCMTKAFTVLNPSVVILLQKLQPIVSIILATLLLGEKLKGPFFFWAALSLVGAVLVSAHDLGQGVSGLMSGSFLLWGAYGLTMLAVALWGACTVFGKKLSDCGYSPLEIMSGRFVFGLIFLAFMVVSKHESLTIAPFSVVKIFGMVLLAGIGGMYFYYKGLAKVSAKAAALTEMFFPFCAVLVNWVFLGQGLETVQLVGGACLLVGSTVIQIKKY